LSAEADDSVVRLVSPNGLPIAKISARPEIFTLPMGMGRSLPSRVDAQLPNWGDADQVAL
jgi:hypothetical protein